MLDFLSNKQWFIGKAALGVHVQLFSEGKEIAFCEARQEGKEIKKKGSQVVKDPKSLPKDNIGTLPAYLSVDGKGVMHFKLNKDEEVTDSVNRFLPNVKLQEFFIQEQMLGDQKWVSLIRKEALQQLLSELANIHIQPVAVSLGAFPLVNYFLIQEEISGEFAFLHYQKKWTFLPEQLLSIKSDESEEQSYFLSQEEELSSKILLPFMHALTHFGLPRYHNKLPVQEVIKNKESFKHQRLFKLGGLASMAIFFVALLVNYLLFDLYSSKAKELESQLSVKKELLQKHRELKQELANKKQFLAASGFSASRSLSFLSDRIAQTVPTSISLVKLSINPKEKNKNKLNETPEFAEGIIRIEGLTKESFILNKWVQELNQLSWVKSVDISSYQSSERKEESAFVLKLTCDQ